MREILLIKFTRMVGEEIVDLNVRMDRIDGVENVPGKGSILYLSSGRMLEVLEDEIYFGEECIRLLTDSEQYWAELERRRSANRPAAYVKDRTLADP